jgi:hypothetical protein
LKIIQSQSPTDEHAEMAATYLGTALEEFEKALKLEEEAWKFIEKLLSKQI